MPFVHDDGRRWWGQARDLPLPAGGQLLIPQAPAGLDRRDRALLLLDDAVEEVDHPLRIEQRVEAVVGAELEQLAEFAPRLVGLILEQVGDAQHAVGLNRLALAVEAHLGIHQRVQELDGAAVLGPAEGGAAAVERLPRRAAAAPASRPRRPASPRARRLVRRPSLVAARLELHDVLEVLPGADLYSFGRERVARVDRDLDVLARVVVAEERDVDLFTRAGRSSRRSAG